MNSEVRIRLKDHQQSQHQNKQNQHQHKHDQNQPVYNQHHQQHHQNQHQHKRKQNQPEYNRVSKVTTASGVSSLSLALPPASLDLLDQFAMTTANLSAHAQYEVRLKSSNNLNEFSTLFSISRLCAKLARQNRSQSSTGPWTGSHSLGWRRAMRRSKSLLILFVKLTTEDKVVSFLSSKISSYPLPGDGGR